MPDGQETLPARDCRYRPTKNGTSVLSAMFLNGEDLHFSVSVHYPGPGCPGDMADITFAGTLNMECYTL